MLSLGGENMMAMKNDKDVQLLSTIVDLQLCQYIGWDSYCDLTNTANELLKGDS